MAVDATSWIRLRQTFEEILDLDPDLRERQIRVQLADAPELVIEALAMLQAHESTVLLEIEKHFLTGDPPPEASLVGTSIGPYRIERLIGRGGMGEVYLAERRHPEFRQKVALKLLLTSVYNTDAMARFRLERQILARLSHPHIAPLLDGGVAADGRPYLVLQYVDGVAITEYCERNALPRRARLDLFCAVARAVEFAHRNLVVHRDLKPGNILVTEEGQVRLLDFGVAKLLDPSPEELDSAMTRAGQRLMTVEYAAPEQIEGRAITTATDIYALGIVLHELLTGVRPKQDPAKRLRGDLETIVAKATDIEPERRYAFAGEMARDVERYLAGEPVLACKPSFTYRLGKLVRRNPLASFLTVVSVLLLLVFAITASWQSRRIASERDTARREQQKAERVVAMMTDLFAMSDPNRTPGGNDLTVGEFLKRVQAEEFQNRGIDPEVQARMKQVLGEVFMARSQFAQAKPLLEDALRLLRAAKGDHDPTAAGAFHDLARLASNTEPSRKVVPLFREALARNRRAFGDRHEKVADAMEDLAESLPATDERLELLNSTLAMRRSLDPKPGIGVASTLSAFGTYYLAKEDLPRAESYFSQSVTMMKQLFPSGHPGTFSVMSNLATVYQHMGRNDEAVAMETQLVDVKTKLLGPDTVDVAVAWSNLGVGQAQKGDLSASEESFTRALKLFKQLLGRDHWRVANDNRNVGCILGLQGKYSEALPFLTEAVEIQHRLGNDELAALGIEAQLGGTMVRAGRIREGTQKLRAVLARYAELNAYSYYMRAAAQVMLGYTLLDSGGYAEAESLFREALEHRRGVLPAGHVQIAEAECGLGAALRLQRKPESMLARSFPIYSASGVADPVSVRQLRKWLGQGTQQ